MSGDRIYHNSLQGTFLEVYTGYELEIICNHTKPSALREDEVDQALD